MFLFIVGHKASGLV